VVRRVLFVICGALRLARFNVITGTADKRYFVGLPIPAGAAVACSVVILLQGEDLTRWMRVSVAVVTYLVALLMVSTFPLLELQGIRLGRSARPFTRCSSSSWPG